MAEHAADLLDAVREALDGLAADGPDRDELEAERAGMQRGWEDPNAGYAVADLLATDELLGAERRTPAAIARGVRSVTVQDMADAIDRARRTALWAVPEHVTPRSTLRRVRTPHREIPDVRAVPAQSAPGEPCEREAMSLLVVAAIAGVSVLGGAGWMLRDRIRRLIPNGR